MPRSKPYTQFPRDSGLGSQSLEALDWVVTTLGQLVGQSNAPSGSGFQALANSGNTTGSGKLVLDTAPALANPVMSKPTADALKLTAVPSSAWGLDFGSSTPVSLPNGATYDLGTGSGIVGVIAEEDGLGAVYFCFGGNVAKLGGDANYIAGGAPGAGQISLLIHFGTPGPFYRFQSNWGATRTLHIAQIKIRPAT